MRNKGKTLSVFNTSGYSSTSGGSTGGRGFGAGGGVAGGSVNDINEILNSFFGEVKKEMMKYLRKDKNDRSTGKIASDVGFEVGEYVSGGTGAIIYKDATTGQTVGEMDKLYIRMKAYFETLEIINVNTVGGKQILSPGGSVKCIAVEELDDVYRCYFLGEQDGEIIENRFVEGDQAFSQMFNAKEGVSNKVSNNYYWRLVTGVSSEVVEYNNQKCHYLDLSITDCDSWSDSPKVGDVINQRGNRTDIDRMNFIEWSAVDAFSPNVTLYHGVNSYSLDNKAYVSFGVDKTTNKAFMDVYGEMYVGDRDETSYMRYTQDGGLEIKGTLSVETKLGDATLKDLISASTPEGYQEFVEKVTQDIEGLQQQIDGAIESYFYQYDPTQTNYPAMGWVEEGTEEAHLNDTFTNLVSGRSWRWTVLDGIYGWTEITDTATTKALALAGQAQDTADGKRRVFVDTPYPPYDLGDLWSRGSEYPLMICVTAKATGTYAESDWDYADNNAKLKEEMESLVQDTKDELNNAIGQATEAANTYTDTAKTELQGVINELNEAKADIADVYTKAEADGEISAAEQAAINAAKAQADAAIALSETTIKAYADGIVTEEEAARIKQAQENLDAAKAYADEKVAEAFDEIGTFDYLKEAYKEETTITGGLVQTSLVKMGYTNSALNLVTMAGINGLYNKNLTGGGIASFWGGDMYDLSDYYTWNGSEWVIKSGVTVPSNIPTGLIRFDGTGYFANGKFWWDSNGRIYADPTALFLAFDPETGSQSLGATILAIEDTIVEFKDMWAKKTDADGNPYLYTTLPIVTQYGVTMYSDATTLDLPTIYDGLPVDGTTIYWENGVIKAVGGGSGVSSWGELSGIPSYLGDTGLTNTLTIKQDGTTLGTFNGSSSVTVNITGGSGGTTTNPLTLQANGTTIGTFDGSSAVTANFNYSNLGLDDRYLKLSGGTLNATPSSSSGALRINNNSDAAAARNLIVLQPNAIVGAVVPIIAGVSLSTNNSATFILDYAGSGSSNNSLGIGFYGNDNLLNILANGNVGIGTTSPSYKLHVEGSFYASSGSFGGNAATATKATQDGNGDVISSTYSPKAGSTSITTLGTITSGIWKGSKIANAYLANSAITINGTSTSLGGSFSTASITAGTAGTSSATSGYTLSVPYVTVNKYGVVTGYGTHTHTINSIPNSSLVNSSVTISGASVSLGGSITQAALRTALGLGSAAYEVRTEFLRYTHISSLTNKDLNYANNMYGTWNYGDDSSQLHTPTNAYGAYISFGDLASSDSSTTRNQTAQISVNCMGDLGRMYVRSREAGNRDVSEFGDWRTVAFVTDNVTSATKLQTARTIWGQSFDGTGDITGTFRQCYSGSYNGGVAHAILNLSSDPYGLLTRIYGTGAVSLQAQRETTTVEYFNLILQPLGGNVGIGTTSPSYKLHVNGTSYHQSTAYFGDSTTYYFGKTGNIVCNELKVLSSTTFENHLYLKNSKYIYGTLTNGTSVTLLSLDSADQVNVGYGAATNGCITFINGSSITLRYGTSHTNGLVLNSTGNIGIGTTSPSSKLHLYSTDNTTLRLQSDGSGGDQGGICMKKASGNGLVFAVENRDFIWQVGASSLTGDGTERMRLTNSGNVGIGTTRPSYKLHVDGDIATNQYLRILAWPGYGSGSCDMWYNGNTSTVHILCNVLANGGITMYSDITKKNILQEETISLDKIANAPSFLYVFKDDEKGLIHLGSSAQYWQGVNQHFVKDNDGVLSMGYGNIALTCAISIARELERYESKTDKQIKKLKKRICELEEQVEQLKAS